MYISDADEQSKAENASNILKKVMPIVLGHMKKSGKETRKMCILFICRLMPLNSTFSFRKDVYELASSLPYATCSYKR